MTEYEMAIYSDDGTLDDSSAMKKYYDLVFKAAATTGIAPPTLFTSPKKTL